MPSINFSVLISVFEKENPIYFDKCLESVFNQSYMPSQVVVVKDGPLTSDLDFILDKWIKISGIIDVVPLDNNLGLAKALNIGINFCNYDYIARMDSDDICYSNRFEVQLDFLENNPEFACCGSFVSEFSVDTNYTSLKRLPHMHEQIVIRAKFNNPMAHPTVIFKKDAVLNVGGYPLMYPEDYLLWIKLLRSNYKLFNIPEPLLFFRISNNIASRRGWKMFKGEFKIARFMLNTSFINFFQFTYFVFVKLILRLSPVYFKKLMYKYFR